MTDQPDRSYRALARQPSLAPVVLAMQLGRIAGSALPIVLVLYALTIYASPPLAGLLAFLSLFPGLVAAPVIGALLDRWGRLSLIKLDYAVATLGTAVLAALAYSGEVPIPAMLGITFVLGVTQMFSDSGLRSLFPRLAPPHLWERVNAVDFDGLPDRDDLRPTARRDALRRRRCGAGVRRVWAALRRRLAGAARGTRAHAPAPQGVRLVDATMEGLRYVWHNQTLRAVSLGVSTSSVCLGIATILLPIVLIDRLAVPEWTVGLAFAVSGVLGIVAAVALGRSNTLGRERFLITVAAAGITISALILLPTTSSAAAIGLACVFLSAAVFGFAGGIWDVAVFTVRQRRTDPRMMGRAFAISMALNSVGYPIGAALGGWLATQSVELAIFVAVGLVSSAPSWAGCSCRRRRTARSRASLGWSAASRLPRRASAARCLRDTRATRPRRVIGRAACPGCSSCSA